MRHLLPAVVTMVGEDALTGVGEFKLAVAESLEMTPDRSFTLVG